VPLPPVAFTVAEPLLAPQAALVDEEVSETAPVAATVALAVAVHPLPLIVTVYVPAARLLAVAVVAPLLQL
jgi:hypothetical protein